MLYFVLNTRSKAVKIGFSDDPAKRLDDLQIASPDRLKLLGVSPGGRLEEAALHAQFADQHLRGEWFRAAPELLAVAKALCDGHRLRGRCPRCGTPNQELRERLDADGFACSDCDPSGMTLRRGHDASGPMQRLPAGGGYRVIRKKLL